MSITADTRITAHAIQRWRQRVDPDASWLATHLAIRKLLNSGRARPTARHWMRRPSAPGTRYVYSASYPGICVIVTGATAVTVITRKLAQTSPRPAIAVEVSGRPRDLAAAVDLRLDVDGCNEDWAA